MLLGGHGKRSGRIIPLVLLVYKMSKTKHLLLQLCNICLQTKHKTYMNLFNLSEEDNNLKLKLLLPEWKDFQKD